MRFDEYTKFELFVIGMFVTCGTMAVLILGGLLYATSVPR